MSMDPYNILGVDKGASTDDKTLKVGGEGNAGTRGAQGFDFSDLGGFNDIFEQFFSGGGGGSRGGGRRQQRGEDLEIELTLELEDVLTEHKRDLTINRQEACDDCDGSGAAEGSDKVTCDECGGSGQVVRTSQSIFGMIQQAAICPTCRGEGEKIESPCGTCRGEGRKQVTASVTVNVPAGIHENP